MKFINSKMKYLSAVELCHDKQNDVLHSREVSGSYRSVFEDFLNGNFAS